MCRSMRYEFAQLARRHDAAFMQLYLPCSLVSFCLRFLFCTRSGDAALHTRDFFALC